MTLQWSRTQCGNLIIIQCFSSEQQLTGARLTPKRNFSTLLVCGAPNAKRKRRARLIDPSSKRERKGEREKLSLCGLFTCTSRNIAEVQPQYWALYSHVVCVDQVCVCMRARVYVCVLHMHQTITHKPKFKKLSLGIRSVGIHSRVGFTQTYAGGK